MDALIKRFKNFQNKVLRRCWLDHYMWVVKKEVSGLMETVMDFRKLCKKYLHSYIDRDDDSDEEMDGSKHNRHQKEGLLKVNSRDYIETQTIFYQDLSTVRKRFKKTMQILMKGMSSTVGKTSDVNYLSEAYVRFNFNNYYY